MTRRIRSGSLALALFLVVGLAARAEAGRPANRPIKNQKVSSYAKYRAHDKATGRFTKVGAKGLLVRSRQRGSGFANPAHTGSSTATIDLRPAVGKRGGAMTVEIPEFYVGSSMGGTSTQRQLFATDIRGKSVPITGTLTVGPNRAGNSFVKAKFVGSIPPGARLSQRGVEQALKGLHVNELSLKWTPASKAATR